MDEIKIPEEGSRANNPEKPSATAGATSFNGPRHRVPPADYSVSKPSRASRKALPDVGTAHTLSGCRLMYSDYLRRDELCRWDIVEAGHSKIWGNAELPAPSSPSKKKAMASSPRTSFLRQSDVFKDF